MEKDATTMYWRHRPGPGAPLGAATGHLKVVSKVADLQRSRSMGGLHQKGDPPSSIQKLCKELDAEDQGQDLRSDNEDTICQAALKEDKQEENQKAPGKLDHETGKTEREADKSDSEAEGEEEQEGANTDDYTQEAKEQESESMKLEDLLEEKPSLFVEVELGDHAEEALTSAMREERTSQMDMGDLSEDETKASWVCCIPYSTRKKVKESV